MNNACKKVWTAPLSDNLMKEAYQIIRVQLEKGTRGEVRNTLQNFVMVLTYDPCSQHPHESVYGAHSADLSRMVDTQGHAHR